MHILTLLHIGTDACDAYESQPMQMFTNYTCTLNDTSGGTPLGFQCISMTYPGLTMDINQYPCYTVYNVTGRHVEVLVSELDIQDCDAMCNVTFISLYID